MTGKDKKLMEGEPIPPHILNDQRKIAAAQRRESKFGNRNKKRKILEEGMEEEGAGLVYDAEPRSKESLKAAAGEEKELEVGKSVKDKLLEKLGEFFDLDGEDFIKKILEKERDPLAEKNAEKIWKRLERQDAGKEMLSEIAAKLIEDLGEDLVGGLLDSGDFKELERDERTAGIIYDKISQSVRKCQEKFSEKEWVSQERKDLPGALKEKELKAKVEKKVDRGIDGILKKINVLRKQMLERGEDVSGLDSEIQSLREKGRQNIVKHCLVALEPGGLADGSKEPEDFWINFFVESAFKYRYDILSDIYKKAFPNTVGGIVRSGRDIFGEPVNPADGTMDTTSERAIAWHALASPQTGKFRDLVGENLSREESEDLLKKKMRELMNDFTTHGILGPPDPQTGERPLLPKSDLDGEACLLILKKAGFDVSRIKYIRQGEEPESGWAFDVTKEHGYAVRDGGRILITNDSNKVSVKDSSARFIYNGLESFGLLNSKDHWGLKKFVEFVTKEDNKDYSDAEARQIIAHYSKNLIGLRRFLTTDALLQIFEEQAKESSDFNPYHQLPMDYLQSLEERKMFVGGMSLKDVTKKLFDSKKYSLETIKQLEEQGFVIDVGGNVGKVLVDTGQTDASGARKRKVGLGWEAARHEGYGAYVVFDEEGKYFSVQTVNDVDVELPQGFAVSKRYWLFTGKDADGNDEKLTTSLEEILRELSKNPDYQMEASLKTALENEKRENAEIEKRMKMLSEGLKIDQIKKSIPQKDFSLPEEEKKKIENVKKLLKEAKFHVRRMAVAVASETDIKDFFERGCLFSEDYLNYYIGEKKKEGKTSVISDFEKEDGKTLRDYLKKNRYNKDEIKPIINLFVRIAELKLIRQK